jgi:hypothetical protein
MNLPEDHDIVDRAVKALRAAEGADALPDAVMDEVRRNINERIATRAASNTDTANRSRVSWLTLAVCVALMVTSSWIIGFQKSLLSRVAIQQTFPNGSVLTHYTDGRVIASVDQATSPIR